MMIYEVRNRTLMISKKKRIDLTPNEHNFLIALSDNHNTTFKEISEKVYGDYDEGRRRNIARIKCNLLKKVNLKIKSVCGIGYRLDTTILFK